MRLLLLIASFLILISGAVYSAYWFYAAGRVGVALSSWSDGKGPLGLTVSGDTTPTIRGFPFDFAMTMGPTKITDATRWPGTSIVVPAMLSWSHPWSPHDWRFKALQTVTVTGAGAGSPHLTIQSLEGEIRQTSGEQGRMVAVSAAAVRIEGSYGDLPISTEQLSMDLSVPEKETQPSGAESIPFALELADTKLPRPLKPLDQTVTGLSVVGAVTGAIPHKPLADALGAWRDAGGTIEVHHLKLDWGSLSLTGNGTLALDKSLQPIGAFSTEISNYGDIIDALATANVLKASEAFYIEKGLGLLAKNDEEGHPLLKTPLTLQNGSLYIGPAKIARLPQFDWQ